MTTIGLLSDTHGFLPPAVFTHFDSVDEIWHAGDIGTQDVSEQLKSFKPLRAVYGNIDGGLLRVEFKE
jgi:predicted phosphodiesterase